MSLSLNELYEENIDALQEELSAKVSKVSQIWVNLISNIPLNDFW